LYQREVSPERRLLDFLRDDLGLKGTKKGCDQGECGACSVIIDRKIVNSCLVLLSQLPERSEIMTIESNEPLVGKLQEAFVMHGATQCGACTPGMIMASAALLMDNPDPSDDELREGLSGVLCRCTGYVKIFDAVKEVQSGLSREHGDGGV
jgi:carbon-monoxide dehydrogenase small subunit